MQNYRLTFLVSPQVKEVEEVYNDIIRLVQEQGEIVYKMKPTEKSLAYAVEKENHAWLADIIFSLPASEVEKLKEKIKKKDMILRTLLVNISTQAVQEITENQKEIPPKDEEEQKEKKTEKDKDHDKQIDKKLNKILQT